MDTALSTAADIPHKPFYTHLYVQVLTAIVIGALLGHFYPHIGEAMKPLGDGFIKLIKMLIAPIIFCTVVHGIASREDMKKVGRVGVKALIYFEGVTTLALIVGLVVVNVLQPGVGMNVDPTTIDTKSIQVYTTKAGQQSTVEFLMHVIPNTVVGAFAEGEILQVLFFAILFAFALFMLGERGKPVLNLIDIVSHALFNIDGTCIYLTMAAIVLAQATNTELTLWQQLGIIGILLLTSKGAAGVTGSGFIVLAATLASVGSIPVASIALILGVDRFMSEARALTNLVGNGVATVVVSKWEDAIDERRMREHLDHETELEADAPERRTPA